jgi:N-carbamoylputrescine amidase
MLKESLYLGSHDKEEVVVTEVDLALTDYMRNTGHS